MADLHIASGHRAARGGGREAEKVRELAPQFMRKAKMGKVSESIYSGSVVVPMADVQHIENHPKNSVPGIVVVTKHTTYNSEIDGWNNSIWIGEPEAAKFKAAWCAYRAELESETIADLTAA